MAIESIYLEGMLYHRLNDDAVLYNLVAGRFYSHIAPPHTPYPFVLYSYAGGYDVNGQGTSRIMSRLLYFVRLVTDRVDQTARDAVDRLDDLLRGTRHARFENFCFSGWRERGMALSHITPNYTIREMGGLYMFEAHRAG